ncbi:MAG: hypothetical protein WED81_06570 [Rhodothermales bacterium]
MSKDKWVNHAKNKLTRGYVLIVGQEKKNANFYSQEKGYEMCAYNVARQLIKDGLVRKVREHHLGEVYELADMPAAVVPPPSKVARSTDDEFEMLLNELEEDTKDESAPEAA